MSPSSQRAGRCQTGFGAAAAGGAGGAGGGGGGLREQPEGGGTDASTAAYRSSPPCRQYVAATGCPCQLPAEPQDGSLSQPKADRSEPCVHHPCTISAPSWPPAR